MYLTKVCAKFQKKISIFKVLAAWAVDLVHSGETMNIFLLLIKKVKFKKMIFYSWKEETLSFS